jgi:hypothetical protein
MGLIKIRLIGNRELTSQNALVADCALLLVEEGFINMITKNENRK